MSYRGQPASNGRKERGRDWLKLIKVILGDLEDEEEGYKSSKLLDWNSSNIEETEIEDTLEVELELVERRAMRSGRMI